MRFKFVIILFFSVLINSSCDYESNFSYVKRITDLNFDSGINVVESMMGDSYYVIVYELKDLNKFIEENPRYIFNKILCKGYIGIGETFFPDDKYNLVVKKENEVFCAHGEKGRASWFGVLNKKTSMIYIEIGFPDFSGD